MWYYLNILLILIIAFPKDPSFKTITQQKKNLNWFLHSYCRLNPVLDLFCTSLIIAFIDDPLFERTIPWNVEVAAQLRDSHPSDDDFRPPRRVADSQILADVDFRRAIDVLRLPMKAVNASPSPFSAREWIDEIADPRQDSWERLNVLINQ